MMTLYHGGVAAWWRGGVVAWWRGGVVAWWCQVCVVYMIKHFKILTNLTQTVWATCQVVAHVRPCHEITATARSMFTGRALCIKRVFVV